MNAVDWAHVAVYAALNLTFFTAGLVTGWLIRHRHAERSKTS